MLFDVYSIDIHIVDIKIQIVISCSDLRVFLFPHIRHCLLFRSVLLNPAFKMSYSRLRDEEDGLAADDSICIYILKPDSHKFPISIQCNASVYDLYEAVREEANHHRQTQTSNASNSSNSIVWTQTNMRLIYRGRILDEKDKRSTLKAQHIEENTVLHLFPKIAKTQPVVAVELSPISSSSSSSSSSTTTNTTTNNRPVPVSLMLQQFHTVHPHHPTTTTTATPTATTPTPLLLVDPDAMRNRQQVKCWCLLLGFMSFFRLLGLLSFFFHAEVWSTNSPLLNITNIMDFIASCIGCYVSYIGLKAVEYIQLEVITSYVKGLTFVCFLSLCVRIMGLILTIQYVKHHDFSTDNTNDDNTNNDDTTSSSSSSSSSSSTSGKYHDDGNNNNTTQDNTNIVLAYTIQGVFIFLIEFAIWVSCLKRAYQFQHDIQNIHGNESLPTTTATTSTTATSTRTTSTRTAFATV